MTTDHAAPVKNGVCLWCGSGVMESGEHLRYDLEPCSTIRALVAERDEARRELRDEMLTQSRAVDRTQAERDEAWREAGVQHERAEAAEAQRDTLAAALRDLLPWAGRQTFENDPVWVAARSALASVSLPTQRNPE